MKLPHIIQREFWIIFILIFWNQRRLPLKMDLDIIWVSLITILGKFEFTFLRASLMHLQSPRRASLMHLQSPRSITLKWKTKLEGRWYDLKLIMTHSTQIMSFWGFVKGMASEGTLRYQESLNKMEELRGLIEHLVKYLGV